MKPIRVPWMLLLCILFCPATFALPSTPLRSDVRKESQSIRHSHLPYHDTSWNKTSLTESSPLSPLVHGSYLQIQAAVHTSYTILVGNTLDGPANTNACSTTALLSSCNLRSAWALCMLFIQTVTCPSSIDEALSVTCAIVLPASSSIAFNSGHGGAMSLSALSSWASMCSNTLVTLSITTTTTTSLIPVAKTNITGDGTSTSLLQLTGIPFVRFSMRNVAVIGFGDGSASFPGAVYLHSLLGATFGPGVQFGPNNVGYNTSGALAVYSLPSLQVLSSTFFGNSAVVQSDFSTLWACGGALSIFFSSNIIISNSTFVNNTLLGGGGRGGALFVLLSNNVTINDCMWFGNNNTGGRGDGGALYFTSSKQISIAHCSFTSNIADDGGAIYLDVKSTFIGMTAVYFSRNVALSGAGGAVYVASSCSYISFGGPMPILETCVGVCDQAINIDAHNVGHSHTVVQEPTNLHVVGYYAVFDDIPRNVIGSCGDHSIVGAYVYGTGLGSGNCTYANGGTTAPGVSGEAPYFYRGSSIAINVTRHNDPGSSYISLWVFPFSDFSSVFANNVAATYGGAIYIGNSVSNVFVMPGTVFTDNTVIAGRGGALFLASYINYLYFYSSMFSGNNASSGGGAVAFQDLISSVHFYSCSFTFNSAQYGGALYLDTGNGNDFTKTGLVKVIEFVNLTMRHNIAALDGGGIYANNLNAFSIAGSRMVDNIAGRSGGAITMNIVNTMSISTSTSFVHNSSGTDGGAICFNANNTITSLVGNTITFSRNTCKGRGGALAMNTGSVVTFNGTATFNSNYAQRQGGAIAVSASSLAFGPGAIKFVNNSALSGSAVYLTSSSTSSVSLLASYIEVLFLNNVCRGGKQGGTVFFVKDPQTTTQLFGPQMTYYNQRVVFVNNTAGVGREVATQTTSLRSTSNHTTIIVTDYNLFLRPSLAFNLVDVFNNINTTDFDTTVSVLFPYPTLSNHHPV